MMNQIDINELTLDELIYIDDVFENLADDGSGELTVDSYVKQYKPEFQNDYRIAWDRAEALIVQYKRTSKAASVIRKLLEPNFGPDQID